MASPIATMPVSWSNKRKAERLNVAAYESLTRMLNRAVADTGTNFSIWSALRTHADQVALFRQNYTPAGRGRQLSTDRAFQGRIWKRKPGGVSVASPDLGSNHQDGLAIDIHPGAIQNWIKSNGLTYGWSWDEGRRVGEDWHFRYIPGRDQMRHEGILSHAAVQRVVGATVDDKIGTGTVAKIKEWQRANGLTADGKVGAQTKAAMGLGGGGHVTTPAPPSSVPAVSDGFTYTYSREEWDTQGVADSVFAFKQDVLGVYLHHPGSGNMTMAGESVAQITARLRGYRADHQNRKGWKDIGYGAAVDMSGNSYELRGLGMEVGSNGVGNNGQYTSIIFIKGNREPLTQEAIDAANGLLAQIKEAHPTAELIDGHRNAPGVSTDCPGDPVMDVLADGGFTWDGTPYVRPPSVVLSGKLVEDGRWGRATTTELQGRLGVTADGMAGPDTLKALQRYLGAPYVDGKISRQPQAAKDLGNGYRKDLIEVGSGDSQMVRLWQAYVGATVDGRLGAETIRRTQVQANASPASFTSDHAETVKLRTKGVLASTPSTPAKSATKRVDEDGRWGRATTTELQKRLGVKADGRMGPASWKALQRRLGHPVVDGLIEHQSYRPAELGNGISPNGWRFTGRNSKGSKTIRRLQAYVQAGTDGTLYEGTTKRVQRMLNASPDAFTSRHSETIKLRTKGL